MLQIQVDVIQNSLLLEESLSSKRRVRLNHEFNFSDLSADTNAFDFLFDLHVAVNASTECSDSEFHLKLFYLQ